MAVVGISETTRRHVAEGSNLYIFRSVNVKYNMIYVVIQCYWSGTLLFALEFPELPFQIMQLSVIKSEFRDTAYSGSQNARIPKTNEHCPGPG
jgi:hypothetical protein